MRLTALALWIIVSTFSAHAHTSRCHLSNNVEQKIFDLQLGSHIKLKLYLPAPYSSEKILKTPSDFSFQKDSQGSTTGIYLHYTSDEGHKIQGLIDYGNGTLLILNTELGSPAMDHFKYFCPHQAQEPTGEITSQTLYGLAPHLAKIVTAKVMLDSRGARALPLGFSR
ncbi:MAG: hypothetical protein K2Q26_08265 [Bdellovibrionales bacterium]|nr:hypothetical protein [Bdellovibrionales bacterium]